MQKIGSNLFFRLLMEKDFLWLWRSWEAVTSIHKLVCFIHDAGFSPSWSFFIIYGVNWYSKGHWKVPQFLMNREVVGVKYGYVTSLLFLHQLLICTHCNIFRNHPLLIVLIEGYEVVEHGHAQIFILFILANKDVVLWSWWYVVSPIIYV